MPQSYRVIRWLVRRLLGVFFRRIEVSGLENVPETGGGIIVAWHPNALVDPSLIFTSFPRHIVFAARHGLFDWPIIGRLMRAVGCVPFYRPQDLPETGSDAARREANRKSLEAMTGAVASGGFTSLFPEGMSHDDPMLKPLKPGVARLYYQSLLETPEGQPPPVLLPVGLHYNKKRMLGSSVLIVYHPPLELDPPLQRPPAATDDTETRKAHYQALTQKIEQSLKDAVHATENWEIHDLLHRARKLIRAERAARSGASLPRPGIAERVAAFRRLWTGYNQRLATHPKEVRMLLNRIRKYDGELAALEIEDHELDAGPKGATPWGTARLILQAVIVYVVLPPILFFGYLVNLPPALLVWAITKRQAPQEKDEATVKMLTGIVAFPLAWLVAAIAFGLGIGADGGSSGGVWLVGALAFVLSALGGLLVFRYQRFAVQTLRAIRLRGTHAEHARAIERLLSERSAICDQALGLAAGLDLPGQVLPDGRVVGANSF